MELAHDAHVQVRYLAICALAASLSAGFGVLGDLQAVTIAHRSADQGAPHRAPLPAIGRTRQAGIAGIFSRASDLRLAAASARRVLQGSNARFESALITALRTTGSAESEPYRMAASRILLNPTVDRQFVRAVASDAETLVGSRLTQSDRAFVKAVEDWRGDYFHSDLLFELSGVHYDPHAAAKIWQRLQRSIGRSFAMRPGAPRLSVERVLPRVTRGSVGVMAESRAVADARALAFDARTGMLRQDSVRTVGDVAVDTAGRLGIPVAATFFDFDNFKSLNTNFGHEIGDEVIRKVSSVIRSQSHDSDLLFRYGGDEFLTISPNVSAADAAQRAKATGARVETEVNEQWLRSVLRERGLASLADRVQPSWRQTISLGVAQASRASSGDELIRAADMSMYRAKELGKNAVVAEELH